ncbi:MAG TPA: COX15/CtaA family protein [Chloroflexota bacterium]|nr:COX15/CtaA family protein [Chloroflexota bacterium]
MQRVTRVLGVAATAGMFLVLVMGATVTNTGSEHGCGRSWPLCHGRLIPQMAVSTAIEFSHRAVVGVESLLIICFAVAAVVSYRRRDIRLLAAVMVLFLFLQAGLGAWAVMAPQLAAVLALHFGVSLIAFASVLLATAAVFEADGAERLRALSLPAGYAPYVWGLTVYSYVVVYLGALTRHVNADDVCRGWPLCSPTMPALSDLVVINLLHRAAALLLVAAIGILVVWTRRLHGRPDLRWGAWGALVLVVLQAGAGAAVVLTHVDLFSALSHAALVGLLFADLTYLCMHVVPPPAVAASRWRLPLVERVGSRGESLLAPADPVLSSQLPPAGSPGRTSRQEVRRPDGG